MCKADRYQSDGKTPQAYFHYLPLIPRLRAMVSNSSYATKMQYRSKHQHDPTKITDIFDGAHYRSLLETHVTIDDEELPMWFFSDPRDVALGFSTDGFGPFKRRNKTAWPLIIFNYNIPPKERFWKEHIISLGTIPGPKKPADMDSFLWPLVQELLQLEIGVLAFDPIAQVTFLISFIFYHSQLIINLQAIFELHAYLIVVFGDIPAISMIMRMKGHNAISPCRMCNIQGIRIPSSRITTHYVPLNCDHFSGVNPGYLAHSLPLRNHDTFLKQAVEVQTALTTTASERLAIKYGIKGLPLLTALTSLSFPLSFPYDFMHLIWSNLIINLIHLWTGQFKNLDHDDQDYVLMPTVWQAIGEATFNAGKTIPTAFGSRVPNIASEKAHMIAETYSIWTLYIAPTLLKGRFQHQRYYKHFIRLVELLMVCFEFELSQVDVDNLETGFQTWVMDYERYLFLLLFMSLFDLIIKLLDYTINMIPSVLHAVH
jgi:tnp2 family transposase